MNSFLNEVKTGGVSQSSVLGGWLNRRQGFERLEQFSDGENEPLDSNINDDSGDETINIKSKQENTIFNNKNISTTFKMGDSL